MMVRKHATTIPQHLPITEAAQLLGMSVRTLQRHLQAGHLPYIKYPTSSGKTRRYHTYISETALNTFIQQNTYNNSNNNK